MSALALYFYILTAFAPPGVALELSRAIMNYQHHLYDLFKRNTFRSVLVYHFTFHGKRARLDVYDPAGWEPQEIGFFNLLETNEQAALDQFTNEYKPAPKCQATGAKFTGGAPCNKNNDGECNHKNCRYPHVCSY
ncbi:Protein of unknown function [Pyronema omphalodes CBS 100304]|uniref:Uncharacterized protein n=1 Tax=Pyronema omphalodes (strain CBS 100304) TaxID=1076935 RepID=U4LN82_PYROM|nr:Protein of unknown function [Pyronema omphalodes CBS 100304]